MLVWRLSTAQFANIFDGGYGLFNNGRWNSKGNRITYCATSPSLCVLEKLVHIEDVTLLPPLRMIAYHVPSGVMSEQTAQSALPVDWIHRTVVTQKLGDDWLKTASTCMMAVPSAVLPLSDSPDLNILINHAHPDAARITVRSIEDFRLDARLLD
jgi:RES domain-containing protein